MNKALDFDSWTGMRPWALLALPRIQAQKKLRMVSYGYPYLWNPCDVSWEVRVRCAPEFHFQGRSRWCNSPPAGRWRKWDAPISGEERSASRSYWWGLEGRRGLKSQDNSINDIYSKCFSKRICIISHYFIIWTLTSVRIGRNLQAFWGQELMMRSDMGHHSELSKVRNKCAKRNSARYRTIRKKHPKTKAFPVCEIMFLNRGSHCILCFHRTAT